MPKFRGLTKDELEQFHKEFVDFLVINGVQPEDWESLKKDKIDDAHKILDSFSDVIFEAICRKVHYLRRVQPKLIECIQCLETEFVYVVMESKNEAIDFTKVDFTMIQDTSTIYVHTYTEKVSNDRSIRVFQKTEEGFSPSDGRWFKLIATTL